MPANPEITNNQPNPGQAATVATKPKPLKLADFVILHERLGTGEAVAEYLGYTWRGYMKLRARLKNGQALNSRLEGLIRHKLSQSKLETINDNKESQATMTDNILNRRSASVSGRKEFSKALKRIRKMLDSGKSRKDIHSYLTGAGRMTISYARFCALLSEDQAAGFTPPPPAEGAVKKAAPAHLSPPVKNFQAARPRKRPSSK